MQRPPDTHLCARLLLAGALIATGALAGCASTGTTPPSTPLAAWPDRLQALLPTDVLLLGEQHDAPEHQRLQRETVLWLAAKGQLAAVVMEMAESGHSTQALPRDATDAQAQAALQWNDAAWPWKAYGPVVMAAVAAGVPVLGGNLPRAQMRAAMGEAPCPPPHWHSNTRRCARATAACCRNRKLPPWPASRSPATRAWRAPPSRPCAPGRRCCWWPGAAMCCAAWECPPTGQPVWCQKWPWRNLGKRKQLSKMKQANQATRML